MYYNKNPKALWPKGKVPYIFGTYPNHSDIKSAMSAIETATGNLIHFIDQTKFGIGHLPSWLVFDSSTDLNTSNVGMFVGPNRIKLRIDKEPSIRNRNIMHELFHAIGFAHEHQSPKRGEYIKINEINIDREKYAKGDFKKFMKQQFDPGVFGCKFEEPYDLESISHYDAFAFSRRVGLKTIEVLDEFKEFEKDMGKKIVLSDGDIAAVKKLYSK